MRYGFLSTISNLGTAIKPNYFPFGFSKGYDILPL